MNGGDQSGIPSYGTQIQVWNGSDYSTISGIGDITGPNPSVAEVETTSHSTGSPHRTFIASLIDDGQIAFPDFWNPTDPTQSILSTYGLEYLFQNRITQKFRFITPDPTHRTREFKGFVLNLSEAYPVAGVCTRNVTLRINQTPVDVVSPITLTPASASATNAGGPGTFEITVGGNPAPYVAVPDVGWLHITTPTGSTTGDTSVSYTADANAAGGAARTGHIMMAAVGLTFTVNQAAGA